MKLSKEEIAEAAVDFNNCSPETLRVAKIVASVLRRESGNCISSEFGYIDFYIRDRYLGRVEKAIQRLYTTLRWPDNQPNAMLYCGQCINFKIWGRIQFQFPTGQMTFNHPCKNHEGNESLMADFDALENISGLPEDLIEYEIIEAKKNID